MLFLTSKHVFENFGGGQLPGPPPLVADLTVETTEERPTADVIISYE